MGWFNRCCKAQKNKCSKNLEVVTLDIEKKAALKNLDHIKDGMKICTYCRDFLSDDENNSSISNDEHNNEDEEDRTSGIESESASHKDQYNVKDLKKNPLAKSMSSCHVNIKRLKSSENIQNIKRLKSGNVKNIKRIKTVNVRKSFGIKRKNFKPLVISSSDDDDDDSDDEPLLKSNGNNYSIEVKAQYFDEIMIQLKSAYRKTGKRTLKMQLLTVVPKSWDALKIQEEFGTSSYLARQAKKIANEKGVLSFNSKIN